MLKENDAWPMLVNLLLILIGALVVILLLANPVVITEVQQWVSDHDILSNLGLFLVAQPLMVVFWFWMKRRQGPFSIERERAPGQWELMATTKSLRQAKELAHDAHRRVRNLQGDVIYQGRQRPLAQ